MIGITGYSAVLSDPIFNDLASVKTITPPNTAKTVSPAAAYAIQAYEMLGAPTGSVGLVCISGPTGETVKAFDKAWQKAEGGDLTGPGFARNRAKRIHPFTLITSLQNQIPAMLTMEYGLKGATLNFIDSATAPVYALMNIQAMRRRHEKVVLVFAAAAYRDEEITKHRIATPERAGIEGAVCLLIDSGDPLGFLTKSEEPTDPEQPIPLPYDPCLAAGLGILDAIKNNLSKRQIPLQDTRGHQAQLQWSRR